MLKELEGVLKKGGNKTAVSKLTSKFYTLIPHDFGRRLPPSIDTLDAIKTKMTMLESLTEIEVAATIIKGAQ